MTRRARLTAAALCCGLAAGCSLPVSVPLSPFAEPADAELITGSIGVVVEETGVAERVGEGAWPALRHAVAKAIEGGDDGDTFPWRNRAQAQAGTVTPVAAYFGADGRMCRRLTVTASTSSKIDVFMAEACRDEGGRWHLAPQPEAA